MSAAEHGMTNGRCYIPTVLSMLREDWILQRMRQRSAEYMEEKALNIWAGTFNVNAKKPVAAVEAMKLLPWLRPTSDSALPDVVAVGFQEIVDLNAVNVVVNNMTYTRATQWEEALATALNCHLSNDDYDVVLSKHLVGILLLVFVKRDHSAHVTDVMGATAGVGIMGVMGNKGGVAVRMRLYDSSVCFVCSHLAAHTHNVAGRNADFANILSKIEFRDTEDGLSQELPSPSSTPAGHALGLGIANHDFVFWLGDLNYRLVEDGSFTVDDCFNHVEKRNFGYLLSREQLLLEKDKGHVFQGFQEGPITFPPTYKFQAGTSFYDRRPDKKVRAPAWCDRVLWRAKDPRAVAQRHYGAVMGIDISDHKPVCASFVAKIQHEVEAKKEVVQREVSRDFDKWESDNKPKVVLSDGGLVGFDAVTYLVPQTKALWIENVGVVPAHFKFTPKLTEAAISKAWLSVAPAFGVLAPRERRQLQFTVVVSHHTVQLLASGQDTLDDTLILRVANGADHFLVVSGHFLPTCFGTSLEQLVVRLEPVRKAAPIKRDVASVQKIPKELWRMVDALYVHGLRTPHLFLDTAKEAVAEAPAIREALDAGTAFAPHRPQSMASVLLHWLQTLRESVVPEQALNLESPRAVVDALSPIHYNTFIYVLSFLRELLKHSDDNQLHVSKLAPVFGRCLLGYAPDRAPTPKLDALERLLVMYLTQGAL
ncbi:inositol polyphosphate 5-phosphatase [Achlya hypogyna]|uniref:Inositol polyphosphate 5-phosphatase n=1 Tax=Achlya hypogyna TaxID=1202772 RepID=A0A1V9YH28_ACHHY|nr:inositol polyphosphate 5-phosphatase [Achlya hypogyna]